MYQALYRKYRPQNLNEVVGQKVIIETLKNAIANNKLSHAYLFTGPRGTGKTSIAKILAKTINCEEVSEGLPCNKCVCCTQIQNKQFSDIIEIDAASNNGVKEIREMCSKVNLIPSLGKYKVYIIDEAHMITSEAFNAFLKTLEEPPEHIMFILATTEPHLIPATIMSRCQRFDFRKININDIVERLTYISDKEKIDIDEEALKLIAEISDGGLRDAINLLDQVNSYKTGKITVEEVHMVNGSISEENKMQFINSILNNNINDVLKCIDDYNNEGKNLIKVLEEILITLKNMLMIKITSNGSDLLIDIDDLIYLIEQINNNLINIKQSNDNKLAIELLLIKLCSYFNNKKSKNVSDAISINAKEEEQISNKLSESKKEKAEPTEEKNIINLEEQEFIKKISTLRINNTLACFDKKIYTLIKQQLENIEEYLMDPKYSEAVSLLMDGEVKAASDEYIIFVYETENSALTFNRNLNIEEEFVAKILQQKYKVIATDNISWEIIKKEFNSKKKIYKYEKEEETNNNNIKEKKDIKNLFNKLIEYE